MFFASIEILTDTELIVEVAPGNKLIQWNSGFRSVMYEQPKDTSINRAKVTMVAHGRWWHHDNSNYH